MLCQPDRFSRLTTIIRLTECLKATRQLTFTASPGPQSSSDWSGQGIGEVLVSGDDATFRFHEQGHFTHANGRRMAFSNVYRFEVIEDRVELYHERRGQQEAVFLFPLIVVEDNRLISLSPHLCVRDLYSGELIMKDGGFDLTWTVEGPRKQEHIHYCYR
ncbi:DUF6314 family protein [Kushneria sp. Sum13]|uniref:DUF6314 family protein n=1 Tax=Kushneria sp. Sum13 TaxID=3459196 RepID=UPI0040461E81